MGYHPTYFGTSLDVALWKASLDLGREPNALKFRTETLDDGQVKVEIVDEDELEGTPPAPEPLPEPTPEEAEAEKKGKKERRIPAGDVPAIPDGLEPTALAQTVLEELLQRIDTTATIETTLKDDTVRIELSDCDEALLLGREGRLLDSLQYLVTRIVQHKERGGPNVFVDVRGHKEARANRVGKMALRVADKAKELGLAIRIEGATSADRRLVHNALADRRDVRTESEGSGAFRSLIVTPANK